jgi:hypothetical protein
MIGSKLKRPTVLSGRLVFFTERTAIDDSVVLWLKPENLLLNPGYQFHG